MESQATRGQQIPGMCGIIVLVRDSEDQGHACRSLGRCTAMLLPGTYLDLHSEYSASRVPHS